MNTYTNMIQIADDLKANGVTPKLTVLPTRKPRKANLYANAVRGGSTRVRCNGGSRSTGKSGSNSALNDIN